jgi:hypothetical protein
VVQVLLEETGKVHSRAAGAKSKMKLVPAAGSALLEQPMMVGAKESRIVKSRKAIRLFATQRLFD